MRGQSDVQYTLNDFCAGRFAIFCDNIEEYIHLLCLCEAKGIRWISGEPPTEHNLCLGYYLPAVYLFCRGTLPAYCSLNYYTVRIPTFKTISFSALVIEEKANRVYLDLKQKYLES